MNTADVVEAVQAFLAPPLTVATATGQPLHGVLGIDADTLWLFQWGVYKVLKTTGLCAVALEASGYWQNSVDSSTVEFPRITVDVYADPTRDPTSHEVTKADAQAKGLLVQSIIAGILHRPYGGDWPGITIGSANHRVTASHRLTGPEVLPVLEGDGMRMIRQTYGLVVG